ncbi:unnamed protein product [Peniophora sp. CBMAI 1063]|nr:unnamed protein product [Peniophora sp. CBMAI 1063]
MPRFPFSVSVILLLFICSMHTVRSQSFNIPSGWQNTKSSTSYAVRLDLARGAAGEVQYWSDPSTGFPDDHQVNSTVSNVAIVLASQDLLSGNSSWKAQVDRILSYYESGLGNLNNMIDNIDAGYWGLAEIAGYLAYNDSESRLQFAQRNFDALYTDFINASAAQAQLYSRTLVTSCPPGTLEGLLFAEHSDRASLVVISSSIGPWIALSARLYELTQNATYLEAAAQSIQFMDSYMVKPTGSNVSISTTFNITSCAPDQAAGTVDNVGLYIEGLSVLANVTGNQTYTQLLEELVPAITSFRPWHTDDGILTDDATYVSKGTLIRGLLEARLRNPGNSTEFIDLIDSYLTIQFNAVQTNAKSANGKDYSNSWNLVDGSSSQYSTVASVQALDVLNAALAIAPRAFHSPISPHRHIQVGVIVGAAVGGIVAALLVVLGGIYHHRRRNARKRLIRDDKVDITQEPSLPVKAEMLTEPFVMPTSDPHNAPVSDSSAKKDAPIVLEYRDVSYNGTPARPSPEAASTSMTPARSTGSDHGAVYALERRLDNLIHALAIRGETEETPPVYEGVDPTAGHAG